MFENDKLERQLAKAQRKKEKQAAKEKKKEIKAAHKAEEQREKARIAAMSPEERKAYNEKLKADQKASRIAEKEAEFKLKDWFSLKGIRAEVKNVHWLTKKELAQNASIVLLFTLVLGIYFYFSDIIIAFILRSLGMS